MFIWDFKLCALCREEKILHTTHNIIDFFVDNRLICIMALRESFGNC